MLGLALRTKSEPDVKEAYGKIKKEESVNDDEKCPDVKWTTKQKPLVVKFNNVAFLEEHGDRFWFFRTHVIPGNNVVRSSFFRCFGTTAFVHCLRVAERCELMSGTDVNKHCKLPFH